MAQKVPRPPLSTTPYAWSTCNTSMNTSGAAAGPGAWYKVTLVLKGVFSPNPPFFNESARLAPYELTHVRASPGDCAAGWAQAWRTI